MPDDIKDIERARWSASLAIAYSETLTTAERLKLLNAAYDTARSHGVSDGIKQALDGLEIPTISLQAV